VNWYVSLMLPKGNKVNPFIQFESRVIIQKTRQGVRSALVRHVTCFSFLRKARIRGLNVQVEMDGGDIAVAAPRAAGPSGTFSKLF